MAQRQPLTGVYLRLPVQWNVLCIFVRQYPRQQATARPSVFDGFWRKWCLYDNVTLTAGQLWTYRFDDFKGGVNDFQLFREGSAQALSSPLQAGQTVVAGTIHQVSHGSVAGSELRDEVRTPKTGAVQAKRTAFGKRKILYVKAKF